MNEIIDVSSENTTATRSNTLGQIAKKICLIMSDAGVIPKTGYNSFHRYKYSSDKDISLALQKLMAKHGVAMFPSIISKNVTIDGKDRYCEVVMSFMFVDSDSGEFMTIESAGDATDKGDKAIYKAITGAQKYALLKTFVCPTGDDPEDDGQSHQSHQNQPNRTNPSAEAPVIKPLTEENIKKLHDQARAVALGGDRKFKKWWSGLAHQEQMAIKSDEKVYNSIKELLMDAEKRFNVGDK